ncbi:Amidase [Pleurostoma richardsiae]|uniref:Amidase n=1 Tax=Pleurostoma richardsiae TaxID=41990 RepID=A0AA38VD69_9PEZI|nr:Amidase [Pleurostoma richardsiae]
MAPTWQEVVAQKRRSQADAIAAVEGKTSSNEAVTGESDITKLAASIAQGDITAEDAAKAYIARAIEAHIQTNCLTEICFEDALRHARELDAHLAQTGKPVGPLHGVPMTLKDQFNVKGYDTTIGYVGRALSPAVDDATIVKMLRSMGAVILAKTNLPQSIMWCETENPLWGLTTNPIDPRYTPGGSTGGESALLYLKGSTVGWGTDIGGSIRIPAHMMGLYGLKPSSARLPYNGVPVSTEGQEHVPSSVGPIARSLSSIQHVMKSLVDLEPWDYDARCVPLPWREGAYHEILSRPLTVGILADDGVVRPHPPVARAVHRATELLRAAGHDVVEWSPDLHPEIIAVQDAFYSADGGEDIRRDVAAGGEPFIPHVERLINRGQAISVFDYWQLNRRKWALQQAYLEKWKAVCSPTTGRPVDVVLMPAMPHTAVPHRACRWVGYTKVWNMLDYPALIVPADKVGPEDDTAEWAYEARNENDEWNAQIWTEHKADMIRLGLPVGLQIIARKLEEEKVLAAGKIIDDLLRAHQV